MVFWEMGRNTPWIPDVGRVSWLVGYGVDHGWLSGLESGAEGRALQTRREFLTVGLLCLRLGNAQWLGFER